MFLGIDSTQAFPFNFHFLIISQEVKRYVLTFLCFSAPYSRDRLVVGLAGLINRGDIASQHAPIDSAAGTLSCGVFPIATTTREPKTTIKRERIGNSNEFLRARDWRDGRYSDYHTACMSLSCRQGELAESGTGSIPMVTRSQVVPPTGLSSKLRAHESPRQFPKDGDRTLLSLEGNRLVHCPEHCLSIRPQYITASIRSGNFTSSSSAEHSVERRLLSEAPKGPRHQT